jgi:hypothetical protein
MNQRQSLNKLDYTFQHKIKRLQKVAAHANSLIDINDKTSTGYVVIEAYNSWTLFCRAFCLSCILGTKTKNGAKVINTFPHNKDLVNAVLYSAQLLKPAARLRVPVARREEPSWQTPASIVTLSTTWNFSNIGSILTGLSLAPDTLKHLRDFRNFIAHRNNDTLNTSLRWARNYGILGLDNPISVLQSYPTGRPQTLIMNWLDDISNTADEMCN